MKQSPTIPPTAVSLWLADNQIHMELPAINGHTSHRLSFPNNAQGWNRVAFIVSNRKVESRLGNEGDLTQFQLDRKLKQKVDITGMPVTKVQPKPTFAPTVSAGAREVMRRLGFL